MIQLKAASAGVDGPGIVLGSATRKLREFARQTLDLREYIPWATRVSYPGRRLERVAYPIHARPPAPVELGVFRWPQGASRWAHGTFPADSDAVDQIRALAYGADGLNWSPLTLQLRSEPMSRSGSLSDGWTVTTQVYVADIRPITGERIRILPFPRPVQMFAITLVDARYLWQFIPCPDLINEASPFEWQQILDKIKDGIGAKSPTNTPGYASWVQDESPSADYFLPHKSIAAFGSPLPYVLDAVASNLGWRFIRYYDGGCRLQTAKGTTYGSNAQTVLDANLAEPRWYRMAGDIRFAPAPLGYGGDPDGRSSAMPSSVSVQFPTAPCGCGSRADHVEEVAISTASYGESGHDGTARFFDTAGASYTAPGDADPSNAADLATLSARIAADFYAWLERAHDIKGEGIVPWVPEGYTDQIIFTHHDEVSTRVISRAPSDRVEQFNHRIGSSDCCPCDGKYVAKSNSSIAARDAESVPPKYHGGTCTVYKLSDNGDGTISPISCGNATVYNMGDDAIDAGKWLQVLSICGYCIANWEECDT